MELRQGRSCDTDDEKVMEGGQDLTVAASQCWERMI